MISNCSNCSLALSITIVIVISIVAKQISKYTLLTPGEPRSEKSKKSNETLF